MDDFLHLDDYAVLGVSPDAEPEAIKQAYRREIAKYHPDRFRSADPQQQQYARERSQRINEAYAALSRNPRTRMRPQPRRVQSRPVTNTEQLAADYERAQQLLAAGAAVEAARLLHQIQKVDPFYRDVDVLLARAEALSPGAGRQRWQKPAAWLAGGALSLLLIGGGIYGWSTLREPLASQPAPDVAVATATATTAVIAEAPTTATAESTVPAIGETLVAGGPAQSTPEVPPTEVVPPPTEVPPTPSEVPPTPTEVPPTPTQAPPPTEVPPTATRVPPPTEVPPPPTRVPRPTAAPRPTQVPRPTATPAPRPVPGIETGQVLAGDNFSNPASGWPVLQAANYSLGYRDGVYVITSQPNTGAVFGYGSPLGANNAIIGADVIAVRGSAGLMFGPNNSYRFLISPDGRYRVEQRGRVLVRPTPSNAVRAGRNRLVLAIVGTRVSVYANGVLLANVNVPAPLRGTNYGFVVVPGAGGGEGIFDSLTVRALPR